jgi:maltokinase
VTDIDAVRSLLQGQRWFGGHVDDAEIEWSRPLPTDPPLTQLLVRAGDDSYQLVLDAAEHDATTDTDASLALLRLVDPAEQPSTVRPLGVEQTNTSLVYDERLLLKFFRRVPATTNPDADVPAALHGVGFANVPPVLARWQTDGRDFAVVQPFLAGAADGWSLALASLRRFVAGTGCERCNDFATDAARLGEITAGLHAALAKAFGTEASDLRTWGAELAGGLRADALRELGEGGASIRVHGDYHLGQVLRGEDRWFIVDFEGEPGRHETERTRRSSPLKDVAGMLRSFDYAAAVAAREHGDPELSRRWEQENRALFLESYWTHASPALLPPAPAARDALLATFELDKALYEISYESAHRPDWVDIPRAAVARLLAA